MIMTEWTTLYSRTTPCHWETYSCRSCSTGTFFPFGRAVPPQQQPVGGPAATMDLSTAYRYNQNMMEY